jgi:NADPH:quinone reductase-like Zn-dependent oxidoreductase
MSYSACQVYPIGFSHACKAGETPRTSGECKPGSDCAGIVTEAGCSSGGGGGIGAPVFGLADGCLGSHVRASSVTLVPLPPGIAFEDAATVPTAFITADAALRQAAGVQPGDR